MNIPNVNNPPDAGEPVGRNREVPDRQRPERADRAEAAEEVHRAAPEADEVEQATVPHARDTYQRTEVQEQQRAERAGRAEEAQRAAPEAEEVEPATVLPTRDMFETTEERELVRELTEIVETTEEHPREEAVARARERVREGYYNTREFQGNLATRLVNTDRTR